MLQDWLILKVPYLLKYKTCIEETKMLRSLVELVMRICTILIL